MNWKTLGIGLRKESPLYPRMRKLKSWTLFARMKRESATFMFGMVCQQPDPNCRTLGRFCRPHGHLEQRG